MAVDQERVQRGMIRYVVLVVDCSAAMKELDFKPSRFAAAVELVRVRCSNRVQASPFPMKLSRSYALMLPTLILLNYNPGLRQGIFGPESPLSTLYCRIVRCNSHSIDRNVWHYAPPRYGKHWVRDSLVDMGSGFVINEIFFGYCTWKGGFEIEMLFLRHAIRRLPSIHSP